MNLSFRPSPGRRLLASCVLSLCVVSASAFAAATTALRTAAPITVDGNLNEAMWANATFTPVTRSVSGTGNNTVSFATLWDDTYLYVAVKVLDANLYNDSTNVWQDDSVEVFIDADHNRGTTYDSFDRQFVQGYNDAALSGIGNQTGVLHAWASISGGYAVEMAIPWSNLAITPVGGTTTIGFDLGCNDDDDGGTTRESHMMWAGAETNSTNTSQFGDLSLSLQTVGASAVALKTLQPITVDGNLNDAVWSLTNRVTRSVVGTGNNTVTFATLWDANYLYVAAKVLDANLFNDSTNTWQDDSVEVYLDADHNHGTTYDAFDRQFTQGYNDSVLAGVGDQTGVLHAWAAITGGYTIEMAIPWSNLGIAATGDVTVLGFDLGVNDDDNGGTTRESQMMWCGTANNSTSTIAFGECLLSSVTVGIPPPTAPSGLAATAVSSSQINLAWTDTSNNETGFSIERKTGAGGTYAEIGTVGANVTSYQSTGLTPLTTYYYRVRAYNASGDSGYATEKNATTLSATTLWDTIGVYWQMNLTNINRFYTSDVKRAAAPKAASVAYFGGDANSTTWTGWQNGGLSNINIFTSWLQAGHRLVVSMRPFPDGDGSTYTLQGANTGAGYYSQYVAFFAALKSYCDNNGINPNQLIIRPAWEANVASFHWTYLATATRTKAQNTADYLRMQRDIFTAQAQQLPGSWRSWNVLGHSGSKADAEAAYPGNAYVDIVELDNYGTSSTPHTPWTDSLRQTAWNVQIDANSSSPNLPWQRTFALNNGKKVGFGEWGISWRGDDKGTEDDPIYINGMISWLNGLVAEGLMTLPNGDPTFACYFHVQASDAKHEIYEVPSTDQYYSPRAHDAFHAGVGGN